MPHYDAYTTSPGMAAATAARQGVMISDIVGHGVSQQQQQQQQQYLAMQAAQLARQQEERTSTDTSMVQSLNRGPV